MNKQYGSKENKSINTTKVLGGHSVPTRLYVDLMAHMESRMHEVAPDTFHTLKSMCDAGFWDGLNSKWLKCKAGRAFAHMVYQGHFPFEFVQYKRSPTKRYLLVQ